MKIHSTAAFILAAMVAMASNVGAGDPDYVAPQPEPQCPPGTMLAHFELDGTHDYYAYDQVWELVHDCTGTVLLEGNGYYNDEADLYCDDICLNPYNTYTFTMYDAFGDGMYKPGHYSIVFDGHLLVDKSTIPNGAWEVTQFGTDTGTCAAKDMPISSTCGGPQSVGLQTVGAEGDPHFKTWNQHMFDFHGQCDLVLMQAPDYNDGEGLDIHLRTKARYQYSYIESAAVRIGEDVLEVGSFGQHFLNGVEDASFPATMGHSAMVTYEQAWAIKKQHRFEISLDKSSKIIIKTFKDLVSATVDAKDRHGFKSSLGLLGSINGKSLARDGKTLLEDPDVFSQEWQVRDTDAKLFQNTESFPQYPDLCMMPSASKESRRRLGEESMISEQAAKAACAAVGRHKDMDACVYDVLATGDLEVAEAGAF